ncbi:MAG: type II toxin-antitoxin system Phd/YefM family antitoxin [Opitutaceae bacterium]|nr:type II toxin-antitoxin system Phd/YefM family antitoxin [Opitutaceae bacterium]MBP9912687.1 type II toxin-antitoxin system Phd/YefM family antitoxin [Opitutaceae bacterium]
MKTASVREIRNAFPSVLKHVKNGHTVAITSRRKVVATLSPPPRDTKSAGKPWADLDERFEKLMAQPPMKVSAVELLADGRERF